MQAVYVKNANTNGNKTWIDRYIALEPKGGVRDVVERMHSGKASRNGNSILLPERVTPAVVRPI